MGCEVGIDATSLHREKSSIVQIDTPRTKDGSLLSTTATWASNQRFQIPGRASSSWLLAMCLCGMAILVSIGCSRLSSGTKSAYSTVPQEPQQKADRAKELNAEGLAALERNQLDEAEQLFSDALAADVNYGPAHNNLGQVLLARKQLYTAAWEFEFASKLMPERSEAITNLGLVYETAGQLDNAALHFESAYALAPGQADTIGNLSRVLIKLEGDPARIHWLLNELILHDTRREWVNWAQDLLNTRYLAAGDSSRFMAEPVNPKPTESLQPTQPLDFLPSPPPRPSDPESTVLESIPLQLGQLVQPDFPVFPSDVPQLPPARTQISPASFARPAVK